MNMKDLIIVEPIIEKLVQRIAEDHEMDPIDALDAFYHSQTYEMLINPELLLWDLSDKALYDLWKTEQATGNPRDSVYL
jgi:hypothetical protein